jgi:HPt (histidine-containing phosphotransfer) domain-containing protein
MVGPTRDSGAATLDSETIEELSSIDPDGRDGFLSDLLQTFLGDSRAHREAMQVALAVDDHKAVRERAHTLKGASRSIGALALGDACEALEHAARAERSQDALAAVEEELEAAHEAVARLLADLG